MIFLTWSLELARLLSIDRNQAFSAQYTRQSLMYSRVIHDDNHLVCNNLVLLLFGVVLDVVLFVKQA